MGEIEKIKYIYIYFTRDEFHLSFFPPFRVRNFTLDSLYSLSFFFTRSINEIRTDRPLVRRMGRTNGATVSNATVRIPRRRRVEKKERVPSAMAVRVYSNGRFHRCQYPILTLRSQHANDPRTSPPPSPAAAALSRVTTATSTTPTPTTRHAIANNSCNSRRVSLDLT